MWQIRDLQTDRILLSGEGKRPSPYALVNENLAGADLSHVTVPYLDLSRADLQGARLGRMTAGTGAFDNRFRILGIAGYFVFVFAMQWAMPYLGRWQTAVVLVAVAAMTIYILVREVRAYQDRQRHGIPIDAPNVETMGEAALVQFERANLAGASLVAARLTHMIGNRACLCGADLRDAQLRTADLVKADLTGADLRGTDLSDACLVDADLSGAVYDEKTRWPVDFLPDRHGAMVRG